MRASRAVATISLVFTVLILAACAAEGPVRPAGLEQKIETARTRADHQEIAAVFERQAISDEESSERHRNLASAYERGLTWVAPPVGSGIRTRRDNQALIAHCRNLARLYQQAAEENRAMAQEHRRLSAHDTD